MSRKDAERLTNLIIETKSDVQESYDLAAQGKELDEMQFRRGELSGLNRALLLIAEVAKSF